MSDIADLYEPDTLDNVPDLGDIRVICKDVACNVSTKIGMGWVFVRFTYKEHLMGVS